MPILSDEEFFGTGQQSPQAKNTKKLLTDEEFFGDKPQGKWDPLGSAAQVGKLVYDIPTQTMGATGSLAESFDENPLSKIDWKDRWQKDAEARTQQRQQELADSGNATGRLLPGTDFIQRKDIADAGASTGFSLVSMAPSVAGTALKAIPYVGPALGTAAGMAGSGTLAYKMDKNTFTRQLLDKANADMQKTSGREMNPAEIDSLLKSTEDIRNDHAMWEAGPEAVGNALTVYGLGKVFEGASGGGLKKIIGGLLADVGGEVATETVTQTGQHNAEVDAGLSDEQRRSFLSPGDWAQSFKDVAPQTVVLSGLLGGGSAVSGKVYDRYRGAGNGQDTDTQDENFTQPADALSQRADAAATAQNPLAAAPVVEPAGPVSRALGTVTPNPLAQGVDSVQARSRLFDRRKNEQSLARNAGQGLPVTPENSVFAQQYDPFDAYGNAPAGGNVDPDAALARTRRYTDIQDAFADQQSQQEAQRRASQDAKEIASATPEHAAMAEAKRRGGLNLAAFGADYDKTSIGQLSKRYPGLFSANGKVQPDEFSSEQGYGSLDEMIQAFLSTGTKKEQAAKAQQDLSVQDEMGREAEKIQKKLGINLDAPRQMPVGNLEEGDKAVVVGSNGLPDVVTHKGYDADGNAILQDGITIHADPFDTIKSMGVKPAKQNDDVWVNPNRREDSSPNQHVQQEQSNKSFDVTHAGNEAYNRQENSKIREAWNDANLVTDSDGSQTRARHDHFSEWQDGGGVSGEVGSQYDAHGIAKGNPLGALLNLLENGINRTRRFDSAPLVTSNGAGAGLGTAGGAYKDGPFIILSRRGGSLLSDGVDTVLVSDAVSGVIPSLRERFPSIRFVKYSEAQSTLSNDVTTGQQNDRTGQLRGAQETLPANDQQGDIARNASAPGQAGSPPAEVLPRTVGATRAATVKGDAQGFIRDQQIRGEAMGTSPVIRQPGEKLGDYLKRKRDDKEMRQTLSQNETNLVAPGADTAGFIRDQQIRRDATATAPARRQPGESWKAFRQRVNAEKEARNAEAEKAQTLQRPAQSEGSGVDQVGGGDVRKGEGNAGVAKKYGQAQPISPERGQGKGDGGQAGGIDHSRVKPMDKIKFVRGGREYTEDVLKVYGPDQKGALQNTYMVDSFGTKYIKHDEVIAVSHRDGSKQRAEQPTPNPPSTSDLPSVNKEMERLVKSINTATAQLDKLNKRAADSYRNSTHTRAQTTTYNAKAGQLSQGRDDEKRQLAKVARKEISEGRPVPQNVIDALGSRIDYDENGKYSPIKTSNLPSVETETAASKGESSKPAPNVNKYGETAKRWKPFETFVFSNPIVGSTGGKIVSYDWAWQGGLKFDKHEGGDVEARVSDWDNAVENPETGRQIVHKFNIETSSGESKTVSLESAQKILGIQGNLLTMVRHERNRRFLQDVARIKSDIFSKFSYTTTDNSVLGGGMQRRKWATHLPGTKEAKSLYDAISSATSGKLNDVHRPLVVTDREISILLKKNGEEIEKLYEKAVLMVGEASKPTVEESSTVQPTSTQGENNGEEKGQGRQGVLNDDGDAEKSVAPSTNKSTVADAIKEAKSAKDIVSWIANNSENASYRLIARRIEKFVGDDIETIVVEPGVDVPGGVPRMLNIASAVYYRNGETGKRKIFFKSSAFKENGINEKAALHESLHAALYDRIKDGNLVKNRGTSLHDAVQDLYKLQNAVVAHLNRKYSAGKETDYEKDMTTGLAASDVQELVAWGLTDSKFQDMLKSIPYESGNAFTRFVKSVMKALGLGKETQNALAELISVSDKILDGKSSKPSSKLSQAQTTPTEPGTTVAEGQAELGRYNKSRVQIVQSVEELPDNVKFMTAWHGSPHDFDAFSTEKIGTGEGAQAYGYGLYFASTKSVAEWYKEKLVAKNVNKERAIEDYLLSLDAERKNYVNELIQITSDIDMSVDEILEDVSGMHTDDIRALFNDLLMSDMGDEFRKFINGHKGRLYQVELAPEEDEYLLWDKPLSEQSEKVDDILDEVMSNPPRSRGTILSLYKRDAQAKVLYAQLSDDLGSDKAASEYIHSLGIRGIKYLDGSSRSKGEGAYNYVIFNDQDISVTAKYQQQQGRIQGAYQQSTDTTFLVADNIPAGKWRKVLEHEGLHRAMASVKFDEMLDDLRKMELRFQRFGNGAVPQWFENARAAAQVDRGKAHYIEEIAAYAVAQYEQAPGVIQRWVDRFLAAVKVALRQVFGVFTKIDPAQLREVALYGLRMRSVDQSGERTDMVGGVAPSYASNTAPEFKPVDPNSPALQKFLQNSQVKEPVYHGSPDEFYIFDRNKLGKNTSSPGTGLGFFFAMDRNESRGYAGPAGETRAFYVDVQNPKRMNASELPKFRGAEEAQAYAKRQQLAGYDGIILEDEGHVIAFEPNQVKSADINTGDFDRGNDDVRRSVVQDLDNYFQEELSSVSQRMSGKIDLKPIETAIATAEYTLTKDPTGKRVMDAIEQKSELKIQLQNLILDGTLSPEALKEAQPDKVFSEHYAETHNTFIDTLKSLNETDKATFADYGWGVDRTGNGFRLVNAEYHDVRTPDGKQIGIVRNKDEALELIHKHHTENHWKKDDVLMRDYKGADDKVNLWAVVSPNGDTVSTHEKETDAILDMMNQEGQLMKSKGYNDAVIKAIRACREAGNRAFDLTVRDLRFVEQQRKEMGLPPMGHDIVDESKRWAVKDKKGKVLAAWPTKKEAELQLKEMAKLKPKFARAVLVRQSDLDITAPAGLHEYIAMIGDLRGTYFPRMREEGGIIMRAINEETGEKILEKFDMWISKGKRISKYGEEIEDSQLMRIAKGLLNYHTPLGRRIRELKKQGYTIKSIEKSEAMPEEVFSVAQFTSSLAAMIDASLENVKQKDDAALSAAFGEIHKLVVGSMADIIKQRGALSSRMKRTEDYWKGFEEDPLKAWVQYATKLAGGISKRDMAQRITMAVTGRDVSWQEFKDQGMGTKWEEYQEFVNQRKINPKIQKRLYKEAMSVTEEVLRNAEQADRVIGTLRGLATLKFMGFRVSSAAVNMTNLFQAVPATISSQAGGGISGALAQVGRSLRARSAYVKGNGSDLDKLIFSEISERGWDVAQFNHEAAGVLRSKAGNAWAKFVDYAMWMFSKAEQINRSTTIHAAYMQAMNNDHAGKNHDELMRIAKTASDKAHGQYGKAYDPAWTRGTGKLLKLPWTFLKFSQNYMLNMREMGIEGDHKEVAWMLLSPAVLAGAGASLVTPLVLVPLAKAFGVGGDDPEEEFYSWFKEQFGSDSIARHGLAGALGLNIKGSIEMNNPLPTSIEELFGAPGSLFFDMRDAAIAAKRGEAFKAVEKLAPSALAQPVKAWREYVEGVTTGSYSRVYYGNQPLKGDAFDAFLRTLSFNPSELSGIREKQWNERKVADRYQKKKSEIYSEIKRKWLQTDGKLKQTDWVEFSGEIEAYNSRVKAAGIPGLQPITKHNIMIMLRRNAKAPKREMMRANLD